MLIVFGCKVLFGFFFVGVCISSIEICINNDVEGWYNGLNKCVLGRV